MPNMINMYGGDGLGTSHDSSKGIYNKKAHNYNLDSWKNLWNMFTGGEPADPVQDPDGTFHSRAGEGRFDGHVFSPPPVGTYETVADPEDQFVFIDGRRAVEPEVEEVKPIKPPKPSGRAKKSSGPVAKAPTFDGGDDFGDLDKLIKDFQGKKGKIDLSPLIALTDSWTGSNLKAGYDAPMSEEEKDAILMRMKGGLAEKRMGRKFDLQDRNAAAAGAAQTRADRLNEGALNRQNALDIARFRTSASAAGKQKTPEQIAKYHAGMKKGYLSSKPYLNRLNALAKVITPPKEVDDESYKNSVVNLNEEIYRAGLKYEELGAAKPGEGYQMAFERKRILAEEEAKRKKGR